MIKCTYHKAGSGAKTATLDAGTLTISGKGAMPNYEAAGSPCNNAHISLNKFFGGQCRLGRLYCNIACISSNIALLSPTSPTSPKTPKNTVKKYSDENSY